MKKNLSKEDLIRQLNVIAETDTGNLPRHRGAMCYEPAMPFEQEGQCDHCGKVYRYCDFDDEHRWEHEILRRVNSLGVEAKVEHWCRDCVEREMTVGDIPLARAVSEEYACGNVLFFRAADQPEFHRALLDSTSDLSILLAFLEGKLDYDGSFGQTEFLQDKLDLIERLTGLEVGK